MDHFSKDAPVPPYSQMSDSDSDAASNGRGGVDIMATSHAATEERMHAHAPAVQHPLQNAHAAAAAPGESTGQRRSGAMLTRGYDDRSSAGTVSGAAGRRLASELRLSRSRRMHRHERENEEKGPDASGWRASQSQRGAAATSAAQLPPPHTLERKKGKAGLAAGAKLRAQKVRSGSSLTDLFARAAELDGDAELHQPSQNSQPYAPMDRNLGTGVDDSEFGAPHSFDSMSADDRAQLATAIAALPSHPSAQHSTQKAGVSTGGIEMAPAAVRFGGATVLGEPQAPASAITAEEGGGMCETPNTAGSEEMTPINSMTICGVQGEMVAKELQQAMTSGRGRTTRRPLTLAAVRDHGRDGGPPARNGEHRGANERANGDGADGRLSRRQVNISKLEASLQEAALLNDAVRQKLGAESKLPQHLDNSLGGAHDALGELLEALREDEERAPENGGFEDSEALGRLVRKRAGLRIGLRMRQQGKADRPRDDVHAGATGRFSRKQRSELAAYGHSLGLARSASQVQLLEGAESDSAAAGGLMDADDAAEAMEAGDLRTRPSFFSQPARRVFGDRLHDFWVHPRMVKLRLLILALFCIGLLVLFPFVKDRLPEDELIEHTYGITPELPYLYVFNDSPLTWIEVHLTVPSTDETAPVHGSNNSPHASGKSFMSSLFSLGPALQSAGRRSKSKFSGSVGSARASHGSSNLPPRNVTVTLQQDGGSMAAANGSVGEAIVLSDPEVFTTDDAAKYYVLTWSNIQSMDAYTSGAGPVVLNVSVSDNGEAIAAEIHPLQLGWFGPAQIWFGLAVLIITLLIIATELLHRTLAAMIGSFLVLGLLLCANKAPSMALVVEWIDASALSLLFGMMVLVGLLAETGAFEVAAFSVVRFARGKSYRLLVLLGVTTAFLSAFLDNVTTILLLVPVTIQICSSLNVDPMPYLLTETMLSNVGGAATLIGDPPNIIIGNALPELTFVKFIVYMAPGVLLIIPFLLVLYRFQFRSYGIGRDLNEYNNLLALRSQFKITKPHLFYQCMIVLAFVVLAFLLHPVHHLDPSWIALMGATLLLLVATPHDIDGPLEAVEWQTLLFFAALFVMMEGLAELGLIRAIADVFEDIIVSVDEDKRQLVAIVILVWGTAVISAFLDNIPMSVALVSVVDQLVNTVPGLTIEALGFALAFGADLGGNGSLVGASANIVMAGLAEKHGTHVGFVQYTKYGFTTMLLSVTIATGYLLLVFEVIV